MRLARDRRGSIYVEFLVVILPFLMLIFGIIQLCMLYVAVGLTQHAANKAVRAAVVVLDDDPRYYGGAARNSVSGGGGGTDPVDAYVRAYGFGGGGGGGGGGGARLQAIRGAASIPLLAISPPIRPVEGTGSVYEVIGGGAPEQYAGRAARYNRSAVAVTFPNGETFGIDSDVTVRVTYLYHCGIPMARYVMCDSIGAVQGSSKGRDLQRAERPWAPEIMGLSGSRFKAIQAQATLPNHGARYEYR